MPAFPDKPLTASTGVHPEIRHAPHERHGPPTHWSTVTNLGRMIAVPEVKDTVNLARQYVEPGYYAEAFMKRLGEIVCHDNFTEMHAFKHHQLPKSRTSSQAVEPKFRA